MPELSAEPKQFGFFGGGGYNAILRDAFAQDGDLRLEEPNLRIVTRSEELDEHPENRLKGMVHA
jgi:hypothetical protein